MSRSSANKTVPAMKIAMNLSPVPMVMKPRPQSGTFSSGPAAP